MALYTFLGAKSHEWTFCDPIKVDDLTKVIDPPRVGRPDQ